MAARRRILVSGGAGFIGSHLCEALVTEGHEVTCLDNLHTGRRSNVEHLLGSGRFKLIEQDVVAPIRVQADEIYNLACPASPVHYQLDPVRTWKTSVLGALHMLDLARETGSKILQASTSEIYGDPQLHPQREDYWGNVNPIGERACYDEGKRCAETLFFDYHRQYGVKIKVARIFNTYGPRMGVDDGRVISTFIAKALAGDPIPLHGDGGQTRSFCFVEDLVDGLIRLMASPSTVTGPINLGRSEEISMVELADLVLELTGSPSTVQLKALPTDDPKRRCPDLAAAIDQLGWTATTALRIGLERTIRSFLGHDHHTAVPSRRTALEM